MNESIHANQSARNETIPPLIPNIDQALGGKRSLSPASSFNGDAQCVRKKYCVGSDCINDWEMISNDDDEMVIPDQTLVWTYARCFLVCVHY